jgi:hypothetical protein
VNVNQLMGDFLAAADLVPGPGGTLSAGVGRVPVHLPRPFGDRQ